MTRASRAMRVRTAAPRLDLAIVFFAALAFYAATLAPTVIWGDSATFSRAALGRGLAYGSAGDHPLFILVARLFARLPGEVARNVNLASACFGALAVACVYRCARQLGASRVAAGTGAAALAVSHAFWLHAVMAEVYTANAFFLAATISLLLSWRASASHGWPVMAAAVFLVGLTNHMVLAAVVPAAVAFVALARGGARMSGRSMLWGMGLAAVGAMLVIVAPGPLEGVVRRLWEGPAGIGPYLDPRFSPRAAAVEAGYYLLYAMYQFPSPALLLAGVGAWALLRRDRQAAVLLFLAVAVNAGVFIKHTVWPSAGGAKYVFYIADYVVFAMLCAVGAQRVLDLVAARRGVTRARTVGWAILACVALVPPAVYAMMPAATERLGIDPVRARSLPYRDGRRFFLNPSKRGEDGARRFGEGVLNTVAPGAVVFADFTPYSVLRYLQVVERRRPDVLLVTSTPDDQVVRVRWMFENGERRPVYVATGPDSYYDFAALDGQYQLVPAGPIFEIRPLGY